ncbi:MAG TPA: hypothetical protein VFC19_37180 [Candidatus Limnocylindrales bacterium]|nr:hypothetical protein [Candidatus Limnocylindrales bacterium]
MADSLSLFAARLARFDPAALIRLKDGWAWGRLPWDVLVRIAIDDPAASDHVIDATTLEKRPDADWRVALPPPHEKTVEVVPAAVVRSAAEAAARTLRDIAGGGLRGRAVGQRVVRDALLDHVVITGRSDDDGSEFAVSQRLVQAIVRMRLLPADNVEVLVAGPWTGLGTSLGSAWYRASSPLTVRPLR